jgi:hypothetical protein
MSNKNDWEDTHNYVVGPGYEEQYSPSRKAFRHREKSLFERHIPWIPGPAPHVDRKAKYKDLV